MENEEEIQKKKGLLQKEILEKNYDKTLFINFCMSKKDNGDDLNNWTYDELKYSVQEFVSSQQQANEEEKKEDEKKEDEEIKAENIKKIEKFNEEEENKYLKEKKLNCKKLEPTELSKKDIKIVVSNPVTVEGGMFGKSYIKYEVTTEPLNWTVERRYSDFDALRKLFQKFYPSFNIPPLPLKKIGNKRFTEHFVQKRMKFLNQFFANILKSESFRCADFLIVFLTYTDRGKFEAKFKEYHSTNLSPYVEEYKTLDGILTISSDEKNERYFRNTSTYFRLQANILDKVNDNLKALNHNMKTVCELVKAIQENFEALHVLNTRVMMKQTITKAYEEISCFFKNWGNILTKQRLLVKDHMKDFFKYVNLEGHAYTELIERREDLKEKFDSENAKLTAKKEKVFSTGDINKMELDPNDKDIDKQRILSDKPYAFEHICFADSKELEILKNQLGYANKMNMRELKKIIRIYCRRFVDNLATFDQGFYPSINDMLNTWTNMENFVQTSNADLKS